MIYIIGYCIIFSLLFYGLLYLVYRRKEKKGTYTDKCIFHKLPSIFGVINLLLGAAFLSLYLISPAGFSSENTIASPIVYTLFSIFCSYFYLVASPLSVGFAGISILLYKKQLTSSKKYLIDIITNIIGALLIGILTCRLFG